MNLVFKKDTHQYFVGEKEKFSVSRILDFYLGSNYNKVPSDVLQKAIIRGNAVHKVAQLYFKNINDENISEKIKEKIKTTPVFTEKILNYSNTLLIYLNDNFRKGLEYVSEQMYCADIVAGTPDLVFKTKILGLYSIIDFKTYKVMNKELRTKAELQLTAYHWLLSKNGFALANTHFITWVQENKVEVISVEITKERLKEWEIALAMFKDEF